ncbi:MAG: hypothetical protein L6R40_008746, partial [Gallowayella cf. fulva]
MRRGASSQHVKPEDIGSILLQITPGFLDDFALVASGPGGPNNVTAACLELNAESQIYTVRVARNEHSDYCTLGGLKDIISTIFMSSSSGLLSYYNSDYFNWKTTLITDQDMESLHREVVVKVIARCKCRIREQAIRLEKRMRFLYGDDHDHFIRPETALTGPWDESTQDIELLGSYCEETHESYMHLCEFRMKQLKELVARVVEPSITSELDALTELSKLAYDVRHSSAFKHFTQANLNRQPPPGISLPTVSKIIDRIGQISKIYRAALTMTAFVTKVKELGKKLAIEAVPTSKIKIPELANRTVAQLGQRAGRNITPEDSHKFKHMLDLWPRYRQHAELQLIVFYEENPRINLDSKHIGCSKQSCYLCYSFIQHHGLFEVDGGHQSLYSLWTIKDTIDFETPDKAQAFRSALRM